MAWDEALLEAVARLGAPVLRFYGWLEPAGTFGYSQRFHQVAQWTHLRPLIRRPTGGGLVPHDADWTYSLVFPPGHFWYRLKARESYERMHEWIRSALVEVGVLTELAQRSNKELVGQCFIGAEQFDLICNGRKLAGAAQRRNRLGLLIQGSLQPTPAGVERSGWERAMCMTTPTEIPVAWQELKPDAGLLRRVGGLTHEKYSQVCYNEAR